MSLTGESSQTYMVKVLTNLMERSHLFPQRAETDFQQRDEVPSPNLVVSAIVLGVDPLKGSTQEGDS